MTPHRSAVDADPVHLEICSGRGNYSVVIGEGSFGKLLSTQDQVVMADRRFASLLANTGSAVILIDAAEDRKTVSFADHLLGRLKSAGATRDTRLVAIGGGVIQDLVTFVASIYMRGLSWSYAPTTLMAMADSCIGGKSSLNVDGFKNLAGNFYPPDAIAVDPTFLTTLSPEQVAAGLAEAAKIAYCRGWDDFRVYIELYQRCINSPSSASELLRHVLSAKKWFIEVDEYDRSERRLLNFGHTFGHAIEAAASFTIPHGVAVALGMVCAADFAATAGTCPAAQQLRVHCLDLLGMVPELATRLAQIDMDRFASAFRADKKHRRGELHLILPLRDGGVSEVSLPDDALTWRSLSGVLESLVLELAP